MYKSRCFSPYQQVIEEEAYAEDESKRVVKYAQTPIMSTYLLAFVIGK